MLISCYIFIIKCYRKLSEATSIAAIVSLVFETASPTDAMTSLACETLSLVCETASLVYEMASLTDEMTSFDKEIAFGVHSSTAVGCILTISIITTFIHSSLALFALKKNKNPIFF